MNQIEEDEDDQLFQQLQDEITQNTLNQIY